MIQNSNDNMNFEDYARANGVMDDTDEVGLVVNMGKKIYPEKTKVFEEIQKLFYDMERRMKIPYIIGCLCTDFKNRLMWSHYADSHKGFCVEYDFSGTDEDTLSKLPLPIFYTERRSLIPWKIAWDNTPETIEEVNAQFMMGLLTKDSSWEYENEWRILIRDTEYSEVKMPRVSCIYLGAVICENNRDEILKIARNLCIPVKQMKMDRGAYDLHVEDVLL